MAVKILDVAALVKDSLEVAETVNLLEPKTPLEKSLVISIRKLKANLREINRQMIAKDETIPLATICTIIRNNLRNRPLQDACNIAATLYGPAFIESLTIIERLRVCETILAFFKEAEASPPITYWQAILENNGELKY